jgi:hypothetical protein
MSKKDFKKQFQPHFQTGPEVFEKDLKRISKIMDFLIYFFLPFQIPTVQWLIT